MLFVWDFTTKPPKIAPKRLKKRKTRLFLPLSEQFGMASETDELDELLFLVNPDEKEITLDVALHIAFVIASKGMR